MNKKYFNSHYFAHLMLVYAQMNKKISFGGIQQDTTDAMIQGCLANVCWLLAGLLGLFDLIEVLFVCISFLRQLLIKCLVKSIMVVGCGQQVKS